MNIGKLINKRRLELKLTLEEVGNAVGVAKSTVKKWEDGYISNMRRDKISKLAQVLDLNPVSLITGVENSDNITPLPNMYSIPLLGTIACGEPITAAENIEDYVSAPEHIKADFALRCKGDSMVDARILDGDIVYIHQQPSVENGEIAAVLIGDEATLKRVYISNDTVTLMPANQKYSPMIYTGEQLNDIRIIGKAVAFISAVV